MMKLLKRIKGKIKNEKGESLSEVLIALLVSVLGMVLLASMITASTNIIMKSKNKMKQYVTAENYVVGHTDTETPPEGITAGTGTVSTGDKPLVNDIGGSTNPLAVSFYSNNVFGNKPVVVYKK